LSAIFQDGRQKLEMLFWSFLKSDRNNIGVYN